MVERDTYIQTGSITVEITPEYCRDLDTAYEKCEEYIRCAPDVAYKVETILSPGNVTNQSSYLSESDSDPDVLPSVIYGIDFLCECSITDDTVYNFMTMDRILQIIKDAFEAVIGVCPVIEAVDYISDFDSEEELLSELSAKANRTLV